jgi:hypothetical protein
VSCFPVGLVRDGVVAVGAYVGILRDRFLAELANDGFDDRVAAAKARFEAADALAESEEATEVWESDDLWAAEGRAQGAAWAAETFPQHTKESSRVAEAAPETPGSGESVPLAPAPGQSLTPDDLVVGDPLACAIRDATQGNPNGMQVVCFVTDKYWEDRRVFTMTGWQWDGDILCTNWAEPAKDFQRLLDWPSYNAEQ